MGLSVSAASAILGLTLLVIIQVSLGDIYPSLTEIYKSYESMRDRSIDKIHTNIEIVNTSTVVNGSGYDLNITVKNTGSTVIDLKYTNVLIEGEKKTFNYQCRYLYPESEVILSIKNLSGTGEQRVKVVTDLGISDYTTYTV